MYLTQPSSSFIAPGNSSWGDPHVRAARRGARNPEYSLGALPVVIGGAGLGVAVFTLGRTLFTSGDFSNTTSTVNYMHTGTPASQTFRRCEMEFALKAHHPRLGVSNPTFRYRLSFEHNGNDLRDVSINALINRSSSLTMSTFSTTWLGQAHSLPSDPVAQVKFQLTGRWDPMGRGDFDFSGGLLVGADGTVQLTVRQDGNWVRVESAPRACARIAPWTPPPPRPAVRAPIINFVFFKPNSATLVEADERRLMTWLNGFSPALKASIANGDSPIQAEGFASTTQGGPANVRLSRQRAERVAQLIRDALGSNTRVNVLARGEYQARTPDRVEAQAERRVVITINHLVLPASP